MDSKTSKKQFEPKVKNTPNNEDLERSILSVIMRDPDAAQDIFIKVNVNDFYSPRHQEIYKHLVERNRNGDTFDFLGASASLTEEQKAKIGGLQYFSDVYSATYSSATYAQDVEMLKQLSIKRTLLKVSEAVGLKVYNNEPSEEILDYAQRELYDIKSSNESRELEAIEEGAERVINNIQELYLAGERRTGLSTGFKNLDKIANGGFLPGQMIVLAARPGCGKTSFAMNIVSNVATKDPEKVVAVFNLEMAKDELIKRLLATNSGVDAKIISSAYNLKPDEINKLYKAQKTIASTHIYLDDTPNISMNEIQLKVRRLQAKLGRMDLVVIDHMQLIADSASKGRSRYEMMTEISRRVKILAKEIGVPVIVLSQMSRDFEKGDNNNVMQGQPQKQRDPKMSDLRESGAIEQDADMILFLTPGDFIVEDDESPLNVVVAKNRSGEADLKLTYAWKKAEMRFEEREHVTSASNEQQEEKKETKKAEEKAEEVTPEYSEMPDYEPVVPEERDNGQPGDMLAELRATVDPDGADKFNKNI